MAEDDLVDSNDGIMDNRSMKASPAPRSTITVHNFNEGVKERLRARATQNGRSREAKARSILSDTLAPYPVKPMKLTEATRRRVAPRGVVESEECPTMMTRNR